LAKVFLLLFLQKKKTLSLACLALCVIIARRVFPNRTLQYIDRIEKTAQRD